MTAATTDAAHGHIAADVPGTLPGLTFTTDGYSLQLREESLAAGPASVLEFIINGPDGHPLVSGFDTTHEKQLHLIAVRRDLTGFQHVHPVLDAAGTWTVPLDVTAAGTWRVFADFAPTALGRTIVLGTDIAVAGSFTPQPLPAPTPTTEVDGYQVALNGEPSVDTETELTFTVTRSGQPVTSLEPYLGAFGHLVTLRSGDLAYLHTHPVDDAAPGEQGGPEIRFLTTFPTAGTFRLFLDFQVDGAVRTAAFTVVVTDSHQ